MSFRIETTPQEGSFDRRIKIYSDDEMLVDFNEEILYDIYYTLRMASSNTEEKDITYEKTI